MLTHGITTIQVADGIDVLKTLATKDPAERHQECEADEGVIKARGLGEAVCELSWTRVYVTAK